jgi:hypothetical protein
MLVDESCKNNMLHLISRPNKTKKMEFQKYALNKNITASEAKC